MARGAHGMSIARCFHLKDAPTHAVGLGEPVEIAVTRLRSESALEGRSSAPPRESGYSVALFLSDSPDHELWLEGRSVFRGGYQAGAVSVTDLDQEPVARIGNPFDILQIYLPRSSLDDIAADHGAPPIRDLSWQRGQKDAVAADFAKLLLPALEGARPNTLFLDHLSLALRTHVCRTYGGLAYGSPRAAGGLAAWQERRAKEFMQTHYGRTFSIAEMARECGLSPSHFTRAFRRSTGMQPHRWLSQVRITAAMDLLLAGDLPLSDIALACGFGDQSHLTRTFTRQVGTSPRAWQLTRRS